MTPYTVLVGDVSKVEPVYDGPDYRVAVRVFNDAVGVAQTASGDRVVLMWNGQILRELSSTQWKRKGA